MARLKNIFTDDRLGFEEQDVYVGSRAIVQGPGRGDEGVQRVALNWRDVFVEGSAHGCEHHGGACELDIMARGSTCLCGLDGACEVSVVRLLAGYGCSKRCLVNSCNVVRQPVDTFV